MKQIFKKLGSKALANHQLVTTANTANGRPTRNALAFAAALEVLG